MIIAVAVVKNLAQNLRDSKNMADMQSKGKKINKQACFRERGYVESFRVKNFQEWCVYPLQKL